MAPYEDDSTILNDWTLWRRIRPGSLVDDLNLKRKRPSTDAFKDSPDGSPMSSYLAELHLSLSLTQEDALEGLEGFGLVSFPVSLARSLGLSIVREPLEKIPAHVLVVGTKKDNIRKALARQCAVMIEPTSL